MEPEFTINDEIDAQHAADVADFVREKSKKRGILVCRVERGLDVLGYVLCDSVFYFPSTPPFTQGLPPGEWRVRVIGRRSSRESALDCAQRDRRRNGTA